LKLSLHTSELGQWETAQRDAHPRLRGYVHGYFASSSYLQKPVLERHLPSTEVPLLINFRSPHRRQTSRNNGSGSWTSHDGIWTIGLQNRFALAEAAGEREFMVVRFTPIGAHAFLGMPMHVLANGAINLAEIDRNLTSEIESRVLRSRGWAARFDAIEQVIAGRIAGRGNVSGAIHSAWNRLVHADGRIALSTLASDLACSHRTLIGEFREHIGIAPKSAARLLRFNRLVRALNALTRDDHEPASKPFIERPGRANSARPTVRWADLAAACGFFDQAHLVREFQSFAGATPAAFLRFVANER